MRNLVLVLSFCFLQSAFAQVFTSNETEALINFDGTLIKEAINLSGNTTFREIQNQQELLIVFEVERFELSDDMLKEEFQDTFFESRYFPQIRMTLKIPGKIDTSVPGHYDLTVPAKITIRKISQNYNVKLSLHVEDRKMKISFNEILKLSMFQVPFAGPGSEIGQNGILSIKGTLSPR